MISTFRTILWQPYAYNVQHIEEVSRGRLKDFFIKNYNFIQVQVYISFVLQV